MGLNETLVAPAPKGILDPRTGKPVGGSTPLHPNHNEKDEVK